MHKFNYFCIEASRVASGCTENSKKSLSVYMLSFHLVIVLYKWWNSMSFLQKQWNSVFSYEEGTQLNHLFIIRKTLPILLRKGKQAFGFFFSGRVCQSLSRKGKMFFFGYIFIGRTLIDTVYKNIDIFGVVKIANCSKSLDRKWWWIFAFRCCRLTAEANYTNLEGSKIMCMCTLFFIFASSGNTTNDKALAYEARSCDGNAELISEMIFKALIGSNGGIWCRRV